ncbi:hypothetical protein NEUTE1DRAFT_117367, partial [Neurospora tetrasperma FGSC 2508]
SYQSVIVVDNKTTLGRENPTSGTYAKPRRKQAEGTHGQVWLYNATKNKKRKCVCSAEQIVRLCCIIPSPLPSLSTPRRAKQC